VNTQRIIVIGGGIVGLASAFKLGRKFPSARVTVLEKEPQVGRHQTGNNSGVLHCGLYYRPGSIKARMAVQGIQEMVAFCFATMLPNLVDLREQYPLSLEAGAPEITACQFTPDGPDAPGTLQIATEFGYKYPVVRKNGIVAPWVMTTDLLLTLQSPACGYELLAVSVKHDSELCNPRTIELLRIEREYWRRQDVFWLLVSPSLYHSAVANSMRVGMPWAVDEAQISDEILNAHNQKQLGQRYCFYFSL